MREFAEHPGDVVMVPKIATSFDTLREAYDFYSLYSWEKGFGIRYGKSRLNVSRTKCMQDIVCGCAGKPIVENTRSCRCECPALIRLLRTKDNGWYVAEHRDGHNHALSQTYGQTIHWPTAVSAEARICVMDTAAVVNEGQLASGLGALNWKDESTCFYLELEDKAGVENTRSCRCECPALIRLLRAEDNGWYIAEHRESHNHSLSLNLGETIH